jgi:hypothetical protein
MDLANALDKRKTDTGPFDSRVKSVEQVKDAIMMFWLDTDAIK